MRGIFLGLAGCLLSVANAVAGTLEGRYINSAYNGEYAYQKAWVEILKSEQGVLTLHFNVPCGTKLTPRVFKINETSQIGGDLELFEEGSSQCYTGPNPRIFLNGNTLRIYSNPRVEVPGFNGFYELTK